ncbi:hypothetical protein COY52_06985 [Candidatus Desantisbacteria bacterium CG_4_10_14_0_8_um_filter_48_22]|uniref:Erythromycin biosynthesis protein CIII-like C-terminal domain-containing protein n=1 Tax=Candidatus Desantisbacteria bacterium CG_4_10_14_0_8_um_filter_48_22 TaxID=1974543 RepID=A0A2M7SAF4_9BACT|nr:MAG: hypothetical protein AUJ67_04915 [Candidatus Desantisbacteria bacterium CG1_02_49_89]PIZ16448.1 MAG: hypothetical protein COY52_06985 [Candidatus Desantisbacteria bacterium CG_4_10_14_0_8_um_filter_48_22]
MAKVVYLSMPEHGHTNPTLPLVKELKSRGEKIIYYSDEPFRRAVEATGAEFRQYQFSFAKKDLRQIAKNPVKVIGLVAEASEELVLRNIDEVRRDDPDYIIHDSVAIWGRIIAGQLKKKAVNTMSTFVLNNEILFMSPDFVFTFPLLVLKGFSYYLQYLKYARLFSRKYGIRMELQDTLMNFEGLNVIFNSRYFQPGSKKLGDAFKFVGTSISEREKDPGFPYQELEGKKVIYISLGSVLDDPDFYCKCFQAFGGKDLLVVLSAGDMVNISDLGAIPDNFIVRNFVPQLEILQKAGLFISHGGMNSVNESLFYGVPLLIIPQQIENLMIAKRLVQLKAGVYIMPKKVSPRNLLEASLRIMSDENYRNGAKKIGDSFREAGGFKKAADEILAYTKEVQSQRVTDSESQSRGVIYHARKTV